MKFCSIASGSSGNCYFIKNDTDALLVDCGISAKAAEDALKYLGESINDVQGILVSHEHIDHIKGIGVLARRYRLPVYATEGTWAGMREKLGDISASQIKLLPKDGSLSIGDFSVKWFTTNHDAQEPVAYIIEQQGKKIGIATDTGVLKPEMIDKLYNSDIVAIEANHDEELLKKGRYPYYLKKRILSDYGHLSNSACGLGLVDIIGPQTKQVLLAHLSQQNNLPLLAYQSVKEILLKASLKGRLMLSVSNKDMTPVIEI